MEEIDMPTIPEIKIAIENKRLFVKDELIKKGVFKRGSNGKLIMYTGGFTAVFPVTIGSETWAFRCWHTNVGNTAKRFQEIANCVKSSGAPYLCDFSYVPEGIIVDGKTYPTTRMRWVEGQTIKDYIIENLYDRNKLLKLANNFLSLTKDMHSRSFAHGDLQHGNILVDKNGNLFLVDYDSFYCKALEGEKDIIKGLVDYQHPARQINQYSNIKLDYFSELIIYISILALAENPSLSSEYQLGSSERMLFSKYDYQNIKSSKIYKDLIQLNNAKISSLLEILVKYLSYKSINELSPFGDICEGNLLQSKESTTDSNTSIPNISLSKFCTNCGKKYYKPFSKYCDNCGKLRV